MSKRGISAALRGRWNRGDDIREESGQICPRSEKMAELSRNMASARTHQKRIDNLLPLQCKNSQNYRKILAI